VSYFVAALPRSRTAWLSVFLSQSGIHCFHDGMNRCNSLAEYSEKIDGCGDSSTGVFMFGLNKMYPDAPVVIIDKNDEEFERCVSWCNETYGVDSRAEILRQRETLSKVKGLRVNQSDIDLRMQEIFEHLTSCEWQNHYSNIKELNIQSDPFNVDFDAAKRLMNERVQ